MKKNLKLFEFLTIFTTVIGGLVGVGIFVKNDNNPGNVLGITENPFLAIILWVVMGTIVVSSIIVFIEIASSTASKGNGTVTYWLRNFTTRRIGSIASVFYVFIYLPVNYGFFALLVGKYVMQAGGADLEQYQELLIFLISGVFLITFNSMINSLTRRAGKMIQIVGTFIKFIPLFLVLIALFIPDKTWGVIFNGEGYIPLGNGETGEVNWNTDWSSISGAKIFAGFSPIFFAFTTFVYAANMQAETKNKKVVMVAVIIGVVFTAIFYIIISIALFFGSKDGSVVGFFEYMFSGFKDIETMSEATRNAAHLTSNIMLVFVSFLGLNAFTLLGPNFIETDINEGIMFFNNKKVSQAKAGLLQMGAGIILYVPLVTASVLTNEENPTYLFDQMSNVIAMMDFLLYLVLIICASINRKTKKVEVKRINSWLFWISAIYSIIGLTAVCGYTFINSFIESPTLAITFGLILVFIAVGWSINEYLFTKKPFVKIDSNNTKNKVKLNNKEEG
ncbi:APC family permease [Mesoplasma photuris]|uniref:APC family permease n=1 Tax=Mesoplasma photuris TaxID=217731 RepID=UPI0004E15526|nr:APC family permease [Mesoplasma photuris]